MVSATGQWQSPPGTASCVKQKCPMQHNKSVELLAYWNRLRGSRAAPERNEIAPSAIASHLADTFILQISAGGESRFRLAGTRICSIYGQELRDLPFVALWRASDRNTISRLVRTCMANKSAIQLNYEGLTGRGRKALFELLFLPLASETNEHYLLGAIIALGKPFWLESDAILENRVQSIAVLGSLPRPKERHETATLPGLAAPLPQTSAMMGREIGHLRLFQGGKNNDKDSNR